MQTKNKSVALLEGASAVGASEAHGPWGAKQSFQVVAIGDGGGGSATVIIEFSNVPTPTEDGHWLTGLEITVEPADDTTPVSDGQQIDAVWRHVRARVSEITTAFVDVYMGG